MRTQVSIAPDVMVDTTSLNSLSGVCRALLNADIKSVIFYKCVAQVSVWLQTLSRKNLFGVKDTQ